MYFVCVELPATLSGYLKIKHLIVNCKYALSLIDWSQLRVYKIKFSKKEIEKGAQFVRCH